jgi:hypothetical protein
MKGNVLLNRQRDWKLVAESLADSELGCSAKTAAIEYAELDRRSWIGITPPAIAASQYLLPTYGVA